MRVRRARQPVVRLAGGAVHGALHGAQHERGHELALGAPRARLEHLAEHVRVAGHEPVLVDAAEPRELLEHRHERGQAVGRGLVVHAEDAGEPGIAQVARHRLVRQDHGLLHERRRVRLAAQVDAHGVPLRIQAHLRLHRGEVQPAGRLARRRALPRQAREPREPARERVVLRSAVGTARRPFQKGLRLVVGQPRIRADERRVQLVAHEARTVVQVQVGRHRAAHLAGLERAQVTRQLLGQHGYHAVGQVHARRPPPRIQVDRRVPGHVMRHVRDMHPQPPAHGPRPALVHEPHAAGHLAALQNDGLQRQSVVEVAGVGGVDGEREALPQVAVALRERARLVQHGGARLGERTVRERRLQLATRHDEVHAHPLVARLPDDLLHHAGGRGVARGERGDANAHERAVRHVRMVGAHGEDVVGYARILGHHHAEGLGHLVAAHERVVRAVDNAQHPRGRLVAGARSALVRLACAALAARGRQGRHLHQIAVEGTGHLRCGNEVGALGRLHEAEAAAMDGQHAARVAAGAASRMRPFACHGATPARATGRFPGPGFSGCRCRPRRPGPPTRRASRPRR